MCGNGFYRVAAWHDHVRCRNSIVLAGSLITAVRRTVRIARLLNQR